MNRPADSSPRILVADDQADVRTALRMLLRGEGFDVQTAESPGEVERRLALEPCDLLLADLNYARDTTSGQEGLELIETIRRTDSLMPIVVMTAFGNVDIAVEVMRRGADDFIEKPWDNHRLVQVLRTQLSLARERRRSRQLQAAHDGTREDEDVIAVSPAMIDVMSMVERVGPADVSVLITGENGVGKGVIAAALHHRSERSDAPLITVDMGTLAENLVESELFGHEPGAFTDARQQRIGRFESADGGTLFLDEIGNCPPQHQPKLLRVIETGQFERLGSSTARSTDVRLLCATNADLDAEVQAGRFRQDLYYRLHTVAIRIPPLRERRDDILPLAERFLERFGRKYRAGDARLGDAARDALVAYGWPGNVRELRQTIERATLLCREGVIESGDLQLPGRRNPAGGSEGRADLDTDLDALLDGSLETMERRMICRALARHTGNVPAAASDLGLSRSALYRRLERFELSVERAIEEDARA